MNFSDKTLIGMIHLPPTMSYKDWPGMDGFIAKAVEDLMALEKAGFDGALIENDEDTPCQVLGMPDVIVPMTLVCQELRRASSISLGVEVLLNDPKASLSIAKVCNLDFIRTDYFVDRMTREGYGEFAIDPEGVIEYREQIGASNIKILADLQVKYAQMVDPRPLGLSAQEALSRGADGVVVTGSKTGTQPLLEDLSEVAKVIDGEIPVLVGSGFTRDNAQTLLEFADGGIVGSSIKSGRYIDPEKAEHLVRLCATLDSSAKFQNDKCIEKGDYGS